MNQVTAVARDPGDIMESVIVKGDLGKLTPSERAHYYTEVCRSVGLNPLTKPFEYIVLNGKLTLYALRGATDQLRSIYKVSVEELSESERDGVYIVTAKVRNAEGRTDMAKGAVTLGSLKGDALANAIMKCETKAKRRATLSICGLGMLDETEIETIPGARRPVAAPVEIIAPSAANGSHDPDTGEIGPREILVPMAGDMADWIGFGRVYIAAVQTSEDRDEATEWQRLNAASISRMEKEAPKVHARMTKAVKAFLDTLPVAESDIEVPPEEDQG